MTTAEGPRDLCGGLEGAAEMLLQLARGMPHKANGNSVLRGFLEKAHSKKGYLNYFKAFLA